MPEEVGKDELIAKMTTAKSANSAAPRVDFDHTELCTGCNPVTCTVNGEPVPVGSWRDLLVNLVEMFIANGNSHINDLFNNPLLKGGSRPFLLKDKPNGETRQITSGHWIYVNFNIAALVDIIGRLCRYCGVSLANVEITYTPKTNGGTAERSMTRHNADSSLLNFSDSSGVTVLQPVIAILSEDYSGGFRFDSTALRLLSNKAGIEIGKNTQSALKQQMFRRGDDVYFPLDLVADAETREDIIEFANALLDEYGCFEMPELYTRYADKLKPKCIRGAEDFETFYAFLGTRDVHCVTAPYIGNRIARRSHGNVWEMFGRIAQKIIAVINDESGGVISEEDLHKRFRAFSAGLLAKIIRNCARDKLLRVEINGIICYQTLDALGLPDDFSDTLSDTLCRLDDLELVPNEEALHTALSLALGVNFKSEYNIPDQAAYRRLIDVYYKAKPPREWKQGVFRETAG
ncbi:MAG: hypothetical protein LBD86_05200 [Spirochaetaceae bacterium]|nr:hypothetical protein [Spirochaetaceae bacterium]